MCSNDNLIHRDKQPCIEVNPYIYEFKYLHDCFDWDGLEIDMLNEEIFGCVCFSDIVSWVNFELYYKQNATRNNSYE